MNFRNKVDYCIGTGRMGLALQQEYMEQLKLVQEEIGFQHIRGHGLFSDDMAIYQEYKDENGEEQIKWVLNEIPDYAEELAKCQRYYKRVRLIGVQTRTNSLIYHVNYTCNMANIPEVSFIGGGSDGWFSLYDNQISNISTGNDTIYAIALVDGTKVGDHDANETIQSVCLSLGFYLELSAEQQ